MILPHDLSTERAILGSAMLHPDGIQKGIPVDSFYSEKHRKIWRVIMELCEEGVTPDIVTVWSKLSDKKTSEIAAHEISTLTDEVVGIQNAADYSARLLDLRSRRKVMEAAMQAYTLAADCDEPLEAITANLSSKIHKACSRRPEPELLKDSLMNLMKSLEDKALGNSEMGMSTGLSDLDRMVRFYPGDLVVVAGRPGMGKTALGLDFILQSALKGKTVFFASLEMPKRAIAARLASKMSEVPSVGFRTGSLSDTQWVSVTAAMGRLSSLPIWVDDSAAVSVGHIRAQAERVRSLSGKLDLVVVDYLGLIREPGKWEAKNEVQVIGHITKLLKQMAKEMDIPVILLSQLNRNVEARKPPKPMLSDLRQSGEVEQDADVVIMLYRPEYYTRENTEPNMKGIGYAQVEKNREGETGDIVLQWIPHTATYSNYRPRQSRTCHYYQD